MFDEDDNGKLKKKCIDCEVPMRVEKHLISKGHSAYALLDDYCFLSKNLYNYANYLVRQVFIITSKLAEGSEITKEQEKYLTSVNEMVDKYNEHKLSIYETKKLKAIENKKELPNKPKEIDYFNKDNKYADYNFVEFYCKEGIDYTSLMAQVAQQTLKLLDKNWISFFESIKKWRVDPSQYTGRPKLPKYLKKSGRNIVIFTNQNCKLEDETVKFPKAINQYILKTKINGKLQQVRVLPRNNHIVIELVYAKETPKIKNDNGKYVSLDLGLDNFATIVNNIGYTPIIINGKKIKSINKYFNKKLSHYKSVAKVMNNKDYTKRMNRLTIKRNNVMSDFIHKASKSVIEYALSCDANCIVIGNNKDWKRNSEMSKVVNQSFVQIPHQAFINQIKYKAQNFGIRIIVTEESYTSGTSFLDNETPIKENYNKSRRKFRGLFISNEGVKINADCNGAYQILRKVFPNSFENGISGVGLHPVKVNVA